jgi:hypothetical protein
MQARRLYRHSRHPGQTNARGPAPTQRPGRLRRSIPATVHARERRPADAILWDSCVPHSWRSRPGPCPTDRSGDPSNGPEGIRCTPSLFPSGGGDHVLVSDFRPAKPGAEQALLYGPRAWPSPPASRTASWRASHSHRPCREKGSSDLCPRVTTAGESISKGWQRAPRRSDLGEGRSDGTSERRPGAGGIRGFRAR